MMRAVLAMPGNEALAKQLVSSLSAREIVLEWRRFPDGEAYVRVCGDVSGAHLLIVCSLANPDPQVPSLLFAARTARELGAAKVTLVAPYLAYMRQDKAFKAGEAVTSACFAAWISQHFDDLVTVDPHLHRYGCLSEIYAIPSQVLHAAPLIGRWVSAHVANPLIVGPDDESRQWASEIASASDAPFVVLEKLRSGDRQVDVRLPDLARWQHHTPVLVDDIVSSGRTMVEAASGLKGQGFSKLICVAVHAVFAGDAQAALAGTFDRIVSTDTVPHPSNAIALAELICQGILNQ
jgi:ribose-phosphate pyrophosphokinase